MRKLLVIILSFFLLLPVLAQDDSATPNLHRIAKIYGAERLGSEWEAFYLVHFPGSRADLYWRDANYTAVVAVTHMLFHSPAHRRYFFRDMDAYFDNIFLYYSPYQLENTCTSGILTLREYTAVSQGKDFLIKHYFENLGANELRLVSLYFPVESEAELNETTALFYPDFVTCAEE